MSITKSWTAAHTGLPSFLLEGAGTLMAGDRIIAVTTGGKTLVSDPLAPAGVTGVYVHGGSRKLVQRRDDGHLITDRTGRRAVPVAWRGEDDDTWESGVELTEVSARRTPLTRYPLVAPTQSGTLECRTTGAASSDRLRSIMTEDRGPIIAIHSPGACDVPGCDIPQVRMLIPTKATSQRTHHVRESRRDWSIPYRAIAVEDRAKIIGAPVITWGEWDAWNQANNQPGWRHHSVMQLATQLAGMPS